MLAALRKPCCSPENTEIADWRPTVAQRFNHRLSLVWRHYRILVALEEDHGARKALGVKKRRTFTIECILLGVRADQPIEVMWFELMGIARKRSDIAHAVITGAATEHIVEHRAPRGLCSRRRYRH